MHHRVIAWVWGSCAAPAALLFSTVPVMVAKEGLSVLPAALFWQGLVAFLFLALSLALFSPALLLPLERTALSPRSKTGLAAIVLIAGASFIASLFKGPVAFSILLGILLDSAVFLWILPRPPKTGESVLPA
jgi:hypothetical protein